MSEKKLSAPTIITREGHSVGKSEEYKRSSHSDFATGKELSEANFSGVRHNSLANQLEIWVLGNLAGAMAYELAQSRPDLWESLYRDVFGLNDVTVVSR